MEHYVTLYRNFHSLLVSVPQRKRPEERNVTTPNRRTGTGDNFQCRRQSTGGRNYETTGARNEEIRIPVITEG